METVSTKNAQIDRITLYASTALVMQCALLGVWGVRYLLLHERNAPMLGWDFLVFWSAARVALEHGAAMVFSQPLMYAMENSVSQLGGVAPWPYPPTFLLPVVPLGPLSFGAAFVLFSGIGIACYALAIRPLARGLRLPQLIVLAAFPGVTVSLLAGQNSLLTMAVAAGALVFIERHSIIAALFIAALAVKPQLAVLIPLALVCARQWKTLFASALLTLAFVAATVVILGRDAWTAFFDFLPVFNRFNVEQGVHLWTGMPTVFAAARVAGLPVAAAYAGQACIAAAAVAVMCWLWIQRTRYALRAAALIVATLLVQPYFMYYDLAWIVLPVVLLMRDGRTVPLNRLEWTTVTAAWLMPAQGFLAVVIGVPLQLAPIVLVALLAIVVRRHLQARRDQAGRPLLASYTPGPGVAP